MAWWFQARAHAGVLSFGPVSGVATRFADPDLLPAVRAVIRRYRRMVIS